MQLSIQVFGKGRADGVQSRSASVIRLYALVRSRFVGRSSGVRKACRENRGRNHAKGSGEVKRCRAETNFLSPLMRGRDHTKAKRDPQCGAAPIAFGYERERPQRAGKGDEPIYPPSVVEWWLRSAWRPFGTKAPLPWPRLSVAPHGAVAQSLRGTLGSHRLFCLGADGDRDLRPQGTRRRSSRWGPPEYAVTATPPQFQ